MFIMSIFSAGDKQNEISYAVAYAYEMNPNENDDNDKKKICNYDSERTDFLEDYDKKIEELSKYFLPNYYKNLVLAIVGYTGDDMKNVANEITSLLVFSDEIEMDKDAEMIIQAYIYGKSYIRYLKENDFENSSAISQKYDKEEANGEYEEKENFYLKVLKYMDDDCTLDFSDGFIPPLSFPFRITNSYNPPEHYGIDITASYGDSIYAVTSAKVVYTGANCNANGGFIGNRCGVIKKDGSEYVWGLGNYVVLEYQKDDEIYYIATMHMQYVYVETGDYVNKGQPIGTLGNSGNSTGTHTHVEIRKSDINFGGKGENCMNPSDFINFEKE